MTDLPLTDVRPLTDPKAGQYGYLVNLIATGGTNGYIIVGANSAVPPIIEFCFEGTYSDKPYYDYWTKRELPAEFATTPEAAETTYGADSDTNQKAQVVSDLWGSFSDKAKQLYPQQVKTIEILIKK